MFKPIMSECKDPECRSSKLYCCGGHSASDVKKNLNNHSTRSRLNIRKVRRFVEEVNHGR